MQGSPPPKRFLTRTATRWVQFAALLAGILVALSSGSSAYSAEDPYDGKLHFTLTPYLWLPTTSGTVSFHTPHGASGRPTLDFSVSPGELLSKLDFALMGTYEARTGNWSAFTDFIYLKTSGENAVVKTIAGPGGMIEIPIDAGTKFGLQGAIWTLAPGYTVYRSPSASLDVFAGFRDAQFKPSLDWNISGPLDLLPRAGSTSETIVVWDGIAGVRGRIWLGADGKWFAPYYGDVGIGSRAFTWQGLTGVGYAFEWGELQLDYRALYYSPQRDVILKHLIQHGPQLTAAFHF
jgi:hypothetical protein